MVRRVHVRGIVQGVGFRPFVYRLAQELGLRGWVHNASDGVHILIAGEEADLDVFCRGLTAKKPPAAVINEIVWETTEEAAGDSFMILESDVVAGERTQVSPDLATCADCLEELFSSNDRRFGYPFINCTNCGPRFTIINQLPYDRAQTSMAGFTMCESCAAEYQNPLHRRFHAQPNACFECGPLLEFKNPQQEEHLLGSTRKLSDLIIKRSVDLLGEGRILAIKGLGGYHLVCDASDEEAVTTLRKRKHRPRKPLAVMMRNLADVQTYFSLRETESALLTSPASPIVLLQIEREETSPSQQESSKLSTGLPGQHDERSNSSEGAQISTLSLSKELAEANPDRTVLAPSLTCGLSELGVMLPATPLQHLLLNAAKKPLVMTSGNISEEPIIGEDVLAQNLLADVADAFLLNDRPIVSRYDDSVVRVLRDQPSEQGRAASSDRVQFIRRARGYAPTPLLIPVSLAKGRSVLAVGPEQKSTFCLASGDEAFISQHLGDLNNANAFSNFLNTVELYERLFALEPSLLVSDLHPDYQSTRWAVEQAEQQGLPLIQVQHHHAHIAAVLAENLTQDDVIGIALDGTGQGTDGTIWGGEFLIASLSDFRRFAHFEPFSLPGGAQAIKHPLRAAYALLLQQGLADHPGASGVRERLGKQKRVIIEQMIQKGVNAPQTSSAGRLFDAISALLGICDEASYEGEPAILLEAALYASNGERSGDEGETLGAEGVELSNEQADGSERNTAHDKAVAASPAPSHNHGDFRSRADHPLPQQIPPTIGEQEQGSAGEVLPPSPLSISPYVMLHTILEGILNGRPTADLSRFFHEAFLQICVDTAVLARSHTGLNAVALSGGVFNNRFIATCLPARLRAQGFTVYVHKVLPPNDGCISYGQAVVASAQLQKYEEAGTLQPCV